MVDLLSDLGRPMLKEGPVEIIHHRSLGLDGNDFTWLVDFLSQLLIDQEVLELLTHEMKEQVLLNRRQNDLLLSQHSLLIPHPSEVLPLHVEHFALLIGNEPGL